MNGSWNNIELNLSKILKKNIHFISKEAISGGCINKSWKVTDNNKKQYFIKTNTPSLKEMFAIEAKSLDELQHSNTIQTPSVFTYGSTPDFSYLVLEFIQMKTLHKQKYLGEQLAEMHQYDLLKKDSLQQYGWKYNNFIGSTPQLNTPQKEWVTFWRDERLLYQLNLAKHKGYSTKAYEEGLMLAESLAVFFTTYQPKPSLLHGDLWGGNCASSENDQPIVFDPAIYYGDREVDIAMTELFGGFNSDFYDSYNDYYALDSDYKTRKTLYNLYHILNHYNLFSGGYDKQAEKMTQQLLSEI